MLLDAIFSIFYKIHEKKKKTCIYDLCHRFGRSNSAHFLPPTGAESPRSRMKDVMVKLTATKRQKKKKGEKYIFIYLYLSMAVAILANV